MEPLVLLIHAYKATAKLRLPAIGRCLPLISCGKIALPRPLHHAPVQDAPNGIGWFDQHLQRKLAVVMLPGFGCLI